MSLIRSLFLYVSPLFILISFSNCNSEEAGESSAEPVETADTTTVQESFDASKYIGTEHPPVPADTEKIGGALAMAAGEVAKNAEYSFLDVHADGRHMLWLSKLVSRDESGAVKWRVIDAIELPEIGEGYIFLIGSCTGESGDDVAAIAMEQDREELENIHKAWAVDRQTEQLIEIDPEKVKCMNEGFLAP